MIVSTDIDVIHIAQQRAARTLNQRAEEFPFGNRRVTVAQIGRGVFYQDLATQTVLHLQDVLAHDLQ